MKRPRVFPGAASFSVIGAFRPKEMSALGHSEKLDFVFIPPDVPHRPFNLSDTEPAIAIVARNDPNEQEHVVL
jgi:hypothetical protein